MIVVAGHADLSLRAPVLELRIRNAVGKGARLIDVGPGGTRLETLSGASHVDAAPGTEHAALHAATSDDDELARALGERSVLIWSAPLRPAVTAVLAHVCQTRGCRVLPTPLVANELGCQHAGLGTHTPDEALAEIESGRIKAIVLLGADPVGDWSQGERWRTALGRAFFALQLTQFQSDSTGWVTTLVPAADLLEKTGTVTNLEGRTQRVRAAATAPPGVPDGYAWASELAGRLGVELPYDPPAAFAEMAETIPAFAGQSYAEIGERAPLPGGPAAASTCRRPDRRRPGTRRDDRGRLPRADGRPGGRPGAAPALPAPHRDRAQPRRRPRPRDRRRRPRLGRVRRPHRQRPRGRLPATAPAHRAAGRARSLRRSRQRLGRPAEEPDA